MSDVSDVSDVSDPGSVARWLGSQSSAVAASIASTVQTRTRPRHPRHHRRLVTCRRGCRSRDGRLVSPRQEHERDQQKLALPIIGGHVCSSTSGATPRSAAGHRRACTPGRSCGAGQASTVLRGTITRTHPTRLDTNGESIGALTRSDSAVGIGLRLPASRDIRALGRKRAGASISGRNVRKLSANPINECGQLGAYRDRKALQMTSPADDRHALRAGGHGCASRRLHRRSAC